MILLNEPAEPVRSLEYYAALIVGCFGLLFAIWTLACHAATFLDVPWTYLSRSWLYAFLPSCYLAYRVSIHFADSYSSGITVTATTLKAPLNLSLAALIAAGLVIFLLDRYNLKYVVAVTCILLIFFLDKPAVLPAPSQEAKPKLNTGRDVLALLILVVIAILFTLCAHRPDLDDSSFIQIASQTLLHRELAPLSYDASLGQILESFRFAPYRIASYELLVAWISEWTFIDLIDVYYLVVPAFSAGLAILVGFIFCRWFLSTTGVALAATGLFLLIMFAWGETHIAYGNRGFVRLFQGKGLIIAITTPLSVIAGLMIVHRPRAINAIILAVANICAMGVSSSGLVITVFTSLIICLVSITRDIKETVYRYALVAGAMIYPLVLAFWIKVGNRTEVSLSDVGTYLPINASLGLGTRESIVLVVLLLGFAVFIPNQNKTLSRVILLVVVVILNPWFSDMMSLITSRNMSWRLAWAAPVPLLLSVSLVAALSAHGNLVMRGARTTKVDIFKIAVVALTLAFLLSHRWVASGSNNVAWKYPSAKLPTEFYAANGIAAEVKKLKLSGKVLSQRDIAAWLPLTLPGIELVMPGHTYPIQLQTILPPREFVLRMKLFEEVNSGAPRLTLLSDELRELNVELIILPSAVNIFSDPRLKRHSELISFIKTDTLFGYSLYRVQYGRLRE